MILAMFPRDFEQFCLIFLAFPCISPPSQASQGLFKWRRQHRLDLRGHVAALCLRPPDFRPGAHHCGPFLTVLPRFSSGALGCRAPKSSRPRLARGIHVKPAILCYSTLLLRSFPSKNARFPCLIRPNPRLSAVLAAPGSGASRRPGREDFDGFQHVGRPQPP